MDLRQALNQTLSNLKTPHVLKNFRLPWPIFESNFETWCRLYDDHLKEKITFDVGAKEHPDTPCWERFRTNEVMSMSEFLEEARNSQLQTRWLTYSYKDVSTWPIALREDISFGALGFDKAEDILFWIGSRGANTPCHYDTYGFNIVVQVFGRKRWLLFPPDTPMEITRVPYEESSVYCKQNFYSPESPTQLSGISDRCHEVILHPGEILIVPNRWWHYVECLDESLAINTWVPMEEEDCRASLEECFVRNFIHQTVQQFDNELRDLILNPNEISNCEPSVSYPQLSMAIGQMILDFKAKRCKRQAIAGHKRDIIADSDHNQLLMLLETHSIKLALVESMSRDKFSDLMTENSSRFAHSEIDKAAADDYANMERLINAICHPKAMRISCDLYIDSLKRGTAVTTKE